MVTKRTRDDIYIIITLFIIGIALAAVYMYTENTTPMMPVSFSVGNSTFRITSYAYTQQQRASGLMNSTVGNSTFMLFYFPQPGIYPFWMKNTYAQLDIIWLNYSSSTRTASVVYIANATPCSYYDSSQTNCTVYTPAGFANYVLEAKAGFVQQNRISVGTQLKFAFG